MDQKSENASRYRRIMQLVPDIVYTLGMDGTITSLSDSFEKITGWKTKDWIGKNFAPIVHPDDLPRAIKIVKKVLNGKSLTSYDLKILAKNGEYLDMEFSSSPDMVGGKIIGKIGIARDVTKHKRIQNEESYLARASKLLSSSLDYKQTLKQLAKLIVPDLGDWCSIHLVNEKGRAMQLTVAHEDPKKVAWALQLQRAYYQKENREDPNNSVNRIVKSGKAEIYPYLSPEFLKKTVVKKSDLALIKKLNLKSVIMVPLSSGKKILGILTLVSTDKRKLYNESDLRFVEEIGRRAGIAIDNAQLYFGAQNEIDARKKIQAELESSKEHLSVVLQNAADGITVFDENAKVVYVNPAIAIASGYRSVRHMLSFPSLWKNNFKVYNEKGELLSVDKLPGRRAVFTKSDIEEVLKYVDKKTGDSRWSNVKVRPIIDKNGKIKGAVSITHDITQSKELERKKDDFISIASHELKTPITSMKGYVHVLKSQHETDSVHRLYLEKMEKQLGRFSELVEDLLEMSRLRSGQLNFRRDKFSFSTLVKEVVSDMQEMDEKHKIILKNGIRKNVVGDRDRISQVLINLISNAIKYSPDSDRVIVEVKKGSDFVKVAVKDYGIGMSMREKNKIFDRFYRVEDVAHKTFPGLGIGLFLSKEIIERHNGKIWFRSKKGRGSTFYFQIPNI